MAFSIVMLVSIDFLYNKFCTNKPIPPQHQAQALQPNQNPIYDKMYEKGNTVYS